MESAFLKQLQHESDGAMQWFGWVGQASRPEREKFRLRPLNAPTGILSAMSQQVSLCNVPRHSDQQRFTQKLHDPTEVQVSAGTRAPD
jgi:hypothetical protein